MSIINKQISFSKKPLPLMMDYTSALPIAFFFVNVTEAVHDKNFGEMGLLIVTMVVADLLTFGIKSISKKASSKLNFLLHRPVGASNTDILSRNGFKPVDAPGFPSGHVTMTAVFAVYRILRLYRNYDNIFTFITNEPLPILFYLGLIVLMGYARWYKRCHNIPQILGGFVLGSVFAIILDKIVRDFL